MTLTWQPPEDNGGSTIAGYIIERKETRSDRWLCINKNPITMTRYRSTGLVEGLEYEYRVFAINSRGNGKPSICSKPIIAMDPIGKYYEMLQMLMHKKLCINHSWLIQLLMHELLYYFLSEPPGPPISPKVTDTTRTSVSLAWQTPEEEGGSVVSGYLVEMQKVDQVEWTKCNTTPTKVCEYTLTHMPQGAEYKFRVMACNAGGAGEPVEVPGIVKVTEMLGKNDNNFSILRKSILFIEYVLNAIMLLMFCSIWSVDVYLSLFRIS